MKRILLLFSILIASVLVAKSQVLVQPNEPVDTTKTYQILLHDGMEFVGNILSIDSTTLVVKTSSIPRLQIPVTNLKNFKLIEDGVLIKGVTYTPNPNPTRYFFSPSAYNLKEGEGYYQNSYLLINSFNIGISDGFSLGAGFEILTTFSAWGGEWSPICFITPKVGFRISDKWNIGAGLLWANLGELSNLGSDENQTLFLGYGLITYGTIERNLTLAIGGGRIEENFMKYPTFTLSGMYRLGRRSSLITENWILSTREENWDYIPYNYQNDIPSTYSYEAIVSYGIRFFGSKLSVDLGFINSSDIIKDIYIGIPYIDFVVKF